MGSIFLFILFIIFLFIFLGLAFLRNIFRFFFRPSNLSGKQAFRDSNNTNSQNRQYHSSNSNGDKQHFHQKVFGKDEGEYVDFEEIK